nr:MAG TPA: hypothetical protein [Caudoviricetes sp.]
MHTKKIRVWSNLNVTPNSFYILLIFILYYLYFSNK